MEQLRLRGSTSELEQELYALAPGMRQGLRAAREYVPWCKREIDHWEAALLYVCAGAHNKRGARFLEVGTAVGYSAAVLALGAPKADVVTLNPKQLEVVEAERNLQSFARVKVVGLPSAAVLAEYLGPLLELIFVDGDHTRDGILEDVKWWRFLLPGGLMIFHDVTPNGGRRPAQPVYDVVMGEFRKARGREPDVWIEAPKQQAMAGWVKGELGDG